MPIFVDQDDYQNCCFTELQYTLMQALKGDKIKFEQGECRLKFKMVSFKSDGAIVVSLEEKD